LGALLSFLGSAWIRCYNRVSVFIAFFALAAVAWLLDQALGRLQSGTGRALFQGLLGLVLVGGVLDQTSAAFVPPYERLKEEYGEDAEFVGRVEASVHEGAKVFQLPSVTFPEGGFTGRMSCQDPLRAYLHSRTLSWSHAAMRGRYGDRWRIWVAGQPLAEMVQTLAQAGFAGIWVDRFGYADGGTEVEAGLARLLGERPEVSRNGRLCFFNLAGYTAHLKAGCSEREWALRRERASLPVLASWPSGFYDPEGAGAVSWRWALDQADLVLNNPSSGPRRVRLTMGLLPAAAEPAPLRIEDPLWDEELTIGQEGRTVSRSLVVPPGNFRVRFHCGGRPRQDPWDPRPAVFRVVNFALAEGEE
jgi:phosphoglycerol transferase